MPRPETFNELAHLRDSGFGKPLPRHGLNLLYWFAHNCVEFYNQGDMVTKEDPTKGRFGFKRFNNRIEDDDDNERLLPHQNFPYYEVGNLYDRGAEKLPLYVRKDKDKSNTDRIIVRRHPNGSFDRVYVTEHDDGSTFNPSRTYRISQGLLKIISTMERQAFLKAVGASNFQPQTATSRLQSTAHLQPQQSDSWCVIL